MTRMKAIARSHLWWPGLDKGLEKVARTCVSCQAVTRLWQIPGGQARKWVWLNCDYNII